MKKIFLAIVCTYLLLVGGSTFFTVMAVEMPTIVGHTDTDGGTLLPGPTSGGEDNTVAQTYLNEKLLPGLTNTFFIFLLSASVGAIVIAGIFYLISMGDSEKTKKAKDIILWTVLGIAIAAISYTLIGILVNTNFLK